MSGACAHVETESPRDNRFHEILGVLKARFKERLAFAELAASTGLTYRQLSRLFRREIGCTPWAALRAIRMREACRLLHSSALSVKEIAGQCGFGDVSHFVREFERLYGASPRRFREWRDGAAQR
jgi:AraC family L-rhamnose operon regulatory protein RhaS